MVFDCMVFLQGAARLHSPSGLCLLLAEHGVIELCVSVDVLREIADVLRRPRVRAKFPSLTADVVEEFMRALNRMTTLFPDVPHEISFSRDPKDEPYLNLVLRAQAHYLVSRDKDLLGLNIVNDSTGEKLRHRCPQLQILEPVSFIAALKEEPRA